MITRTTACAMFCLAAIIAVALVGCRRDNGYKAAMYAKYLTAELRVGMTKKEVDDLIGGHVAYDHGWNNDGTTRWEISPMPPTYKYPANYKDMKHHVEEFRYGPHDPPTDAPRRAWNAPYEGDTKSYRLVLTFVDEKLVEWERNWPVEE